MFTIKHSDKKELNKSYSSKSSRGHDNNSISVTTETTNFIVYNILTFFVTLKGTNYNISINSYNWNHLSFFFAFQLYLPFPFYFAEIFRHINRFFITDLIFGKHEGGSCFSNSSISSFVISFVIVSTIVEKFEIKLYNHL